SIQQVPKGVGMTAGAYEYQSPNHSFGPPVIVTVTFEPIASGVTSRLAFPPLPAWAKRGSAQRQSTARTDRRCMRGSKQGRKRTMECNPEGPRAGKPRTSGAGSFWAGDGVQRGAQGSAMPGTSALHPPLGAVPGRGLGRPLGEGDPAAKAAFALELLR